MKSWSLAVVSGLVISVILFGPLSHAGFVYDDRWRVVENPAIRTIQPSAFFLDRESVADAQSGLSTDIYNPLTTLFFAVDFHFFRLRPSFYHIENISWHLLNALLFGAIVFTLGKNSWIACISALIFLIHPVQLQSVAWISQRSTVLSAFFELVALAAFLGTPGRSLTASGIGVVSYALALGAKESAVTFPLLYAVISWWRFRQASSEPRYQSRDVILVMILLAMSFLFLVWRGHVLGQWSQVADRTITSEWLLGFLAWPVYLGKVLVPMALRPSYLYPSVTTSIVFVALVSWLASTMIGAFSIKRRPALAASLA